jgi:hypothetical protein
MPVFEVEDLESTVRTLQAWGWQPEGGRFEIPNRPCYRFTDPSGNAFALFQNVRPQAMERAYADAVRDELK